MATHCPAQMDVLIHGRLCPAQLTNVICHPAPDVPSLCHPWKVATHLMYSPPSAPLSLVIDQGAAYVPVSLGNCPSLPKLARQSAWELRPRQMWRAHSAVLAHGSATPLFQQEYMLRLARDIAGRRYLESAGYFPLSHSTADWLSPINADDHGGTRW